MTCKILGLRLDSAMASIEGVDLAIVDVDDLADTAKEYGVNAVPTVLGIKNGRIVDKFVGLKGEEQVATFIKKLCG